MVIRFTTELKSAIVANPLLVKQEMPVLEAIAQMANARTSSMASDIADGDYVHQEARSTCVLVMEQEQVIGIITEREVVKFFDQFSQVNTLANVTVGEVMRSPVIMYEDDFDDLFMAVNLLQRNHIRQVVVLDQGDRLLGIVTHESLMQLVQPLDVLLAQWELDLQHSEQRFAALAAAAPVGIFRTDIEGNCIYVNDRWCEIAGLSIGEAAGFGWVNAIHPSDRELVATEWNNSVHENRPFRLEYRFLNQSGQITWAYGQAVAEHDQAGEIIGYVGTITDISDRKQSEEKSQQRLDILEAARDIIASADVTGKVTYLNQAGRDLMGLAPDVDIFQTAISDYHAAEVSDFVLQQAIPQCVDQGFWSGETLFRRHDGSTFPVLQVIVCHRGQNNSINQFSTIARDISDRKQSEQKLQELNQELETKVNERTQELWRVNSLQRAILDGADYSFISTDVNGTIQTFNAAAEKMLGYEASEVIGKVTPAIVHDRQEVIDRATSLSIELGQDIPVGFEVFVAKTRLGMVSEEEWTYIRKDGSRFPVLLSVTALKDINQEIIGFLGIAKDISEQQATLRDRLQAEQAIAKYASEVEDLYNNAPCGYHSLDGEGMIVTINNTELQWLGYSREEILGKSFMEIITADSQQIFHSSFDDFKRRGSAQNIEYDLICKDGTILPVFLSATAVKDEEGNYLYSRSTLFNARDRKQAELAIQESEERFRYLADNAPVMIWMTGLDKLCCYFNKPWLEFTGQTMAESDGWEELIHVDDRQFYIDSYEEIFDTRQSFSLEYRLKRFDGKYRWLLATGHPRFDADGEFLGYIGSCIDINDRKQSEQEILEKQRFIQKIADSSPNILYIYDLHENRNVYCNREITDTLGYSPAEVQAMGASFFANLMHPDDLAKIPDYYGQIDAAQDGDIFEIEYRMRHANGEWRWLFSRDTVFSRDDRGQVKQTIGTAQDISDRKQSEITIQQTTAMLEASNRELEAFAYSVSHDLRSPLRAIDGFSNALLEDYGDKFDDEAKDYFDRIRRNIQRMGMLIDDLLRLSRVSRSEMQYQPVNLSELVRQQIQELQAIDSDRIVECIIKDEAIVQADAALMAVVINNLCQNAWKFTSHHPTAKIEFGITQQDAQDSQPIYFVRDDGAGFDMNYTNKLFGVFQRLHNTNEFSGTGIGLATVQRAIHRHGGKVWAEAAVEQGATFYFTVPTVRSNGR
jgi:PAS domain S-box-containing protein